MKYQSFHYSAFAILLSASLTLHSCKKGDEIRLEQKDITEAVFASGYIMADDEYKVITMGDGMITKRWVEEGDTIVEGQILFSILNDAQQARVKASSAVYENAVQNTGAGSPVLQEMQSRMKNAQAKLSLDSLNYFRMKNLWEKNAIARVEYDKASLSYNLSKNDLVIALETYNKTKRQLDVEKSNAQSQLAGSRVDLDNYSIKALMNGMVYEIYKEPGEVVKRNDVLALVGNAHHRFARLSVDQQDIEKLSVGQKTIIKSDISGNKILYGKVSKIYPNMNQNDQSFRVDVEFDDMLKTPYIHASVEANIVVNQKKAAWVIPRKVLNGDGTVKVKGDTKTRALKLGVMNNDYVEVLSGLEKNEILEVPKE